MIPNPDEMRRRAIGERELAEWSAQHAEPFALANDPTPHRPTRFENGDKRQRVCVEGMDLLPGQLDLF
jgi:hypothetical protein